eukprot:scaffold38477_cov90-Phaeocystis_antarctica.AAC.1
MRCHRSPRPLGTAPHTRTTRRLHAVEVAANRGRVGSLRNDPVQRNRRDIGGEITHARHAGLWSWLAAISAAAGV